MHMENFKPCGKSRLYGTLHSACKTEYNCIYTISKYTSVRSSSEHWKKVIRSMNYNLMKQPRDSVLAHFRMSVVMTFIRPLQIDGFPNPNIML